MDVARALRPIVLLSVFTSISFFLFLRPASADGVTVTIDTTSLTMVEGDSFTLDSTVTNDSGSAISLTAVGIGAGFLSGDPDQTDSPNDFNFLVGGCVTSSFLDSKGLTAFTFASLDPGSSCVLSIRVTASGNDFFPEDADAGVWDLNTDVTYTCDGCGNVEVNSLEKIITVEDQPSSSVPEPSSLLLLAAGLLGFPFIPRFREP